MSSISSRDRSHSLLEKECIHSVIGKTKITGEIGISRIDVW